MEFIKIMIPAALILFSTSKINVVQSINDKVVITTRHGAIEGRTRHFPDINQPIKSVQKFLGIPYAAAPTGELRFKPPQPHPDWKPDVYNATYFRSICIQDPSYNVYFWPNFSYPQSEDCLYLNVYAPDRRNTSEEEHYPVMMYIHGGGYEVGTPMTTPGDVVPLWGVVLVTIQYRLGPFGFVTTGDSVAPGNYGMLDQVEALKWIKENIKDFGGDPSKVTIFGESAGGSSVGLLVLSPRSKGLFHRAIAISGVELSPFATGNKTFAVLHTKELASLMKCPAEESSEMIKCLRSKDATEIPLGRGNIWRPVVDDDFLPNTPENLRQTGKFNRVPLMSGFTSQEGAYFFPTQIRQVTPETFREVTSFCLNFIHSRYGQTYSLSSPPVPNTPLDAAVFSYTPWPYVNDLYKVKRGLANMVTDSSVASPTHSALTSHSKQSPAYMYEFAHRSKLNPAPSWLGVRHKDDTPYEFGFPLMNLTVLQTYDDVDRNISEMIITLFTNFAKYGNPTHLPVRGVSWDRFNSSNMAYLRIQAKPEMALNFRPTCMAFWKEYFTKLLQPRVCPITAMSSRGAHANQIHSRVFVVLFSIVFML